MPDGYRIRPARENDAAACRRIEIAADELFRGLDLHDPDPDETNLTDDALAAAARAGLLWVAVGEDDVPIGFALAAVLDGHGHLYELDVDPAHGRRGLGRRLVETVLRWAEAQGFTRVTLTTYRDVPWNAPYYERLGFRVVLPEALSPALRALVARESALGLDAGKRVVMCRDVGPRAGPGA